MLYAFNAAPAMQPPNQPLVWSLNLAGVPPGPKGLYDGIYVDCVHNPPPDFQVCTALDDNGQSSPFANTDVGVTGTPVIDLSGGANNYTLYVVAAIYFPSAQSTGYYLLAVNITNKTVISTPITGTVNGQHAYPHCTTSSGQGSLNFDNNHIQRSGLLLLNGKLYVAFAAGPGDEVENGWLFAYSFTSNTFSQTAAFSTTPDGTGGGIWGSGAGPASDGNSIFVTTGNGTFDLNGSNPLDNDAGDSLLKLTPALVRSDYYTPSNVFSYNNKQGRCDADIDLGSGGVLLPTNFTYTGSNGGCSSGCRVAINADKESKLYVANTANLGGFDGTKDCNSNFNNIQCVTTPAVPSNDPLQGYWASPAFWTYTSGSTTKYMLYYAATMQSTTAGVAPEAINAYQLQTSGSPGPIPSAVPYARTPTLFCDFSPTPSVSSSGTQAATGIVWAIETNQNSDNDGIYQPFDCNGSIPQGDPAALHAFNATTLAEIYTSRQVATPINQTHAFPTPTVSDGQVYVGADNQVNVFGLCSKGVGRICKR
jgi:hypothetical protein